MILKNIMTVEDAKKILNECQTKKLTPKRLEKIKEAMKTVVKNAFTPPQEE